MILLMGAALLVAQLVNFAFLLSGQQRLSLAQTEGPAINWFAEVAREVTLEAPPDRDAVLGNRGRRRLRVFSIDSESFVATHAAARDGRLEDRLRSALTSAGVDVRQVHAARTVDPSLFPRMPERRRLRGEGRWQAVLLSAQLPDGSWLNGRMLVPRPDPWLITRLSLATLALYVLVLGAVLWIAWRIARPLRDLTRAAESFEGRREVPAVEPRGPSDLRHAITAFNAMNRRVITLLDEKDRMLGAIGHDLRTPLASLRIRAESMNPAEERDAIVRTIEEMSETLEDILVLARTGRAREPARKMDVGALVDAVVEEFHDLGADVSFDSPASRVAVEVQPNLLRRAIRNLIDNGIKYGERVRVRVLPAGKGAAIEIDDDGPGIPADQMAAVLRPFERLETSRSRDTGGAGLGLAIAHAVAEGHGGRLDLSNRAEGGLTARLTLPG
jgi:signal transduction histidine kinase